jgi:predicted ATPase
MATQFVGRRRQLSELGAAVEAAMVGHGSLILVTGEAGVGKSRLADEAAAAATARGVGVIRARCWESGAPGYWPWIQLLRAALRRDPGVGDELPAATRRKLALLLPELRSTSHRSRRTSEAGGVAAGDRIELLDAVITCLRLSAQRRPMLAVIDDIQWSDAASVLGLRLIADELHDVSMCLLALERRPDGSADADVRREVEMIGRTVMRIELGGLSEAEVADLMEAVGRPATDPAIVASVRHRTGGNALYVVELLKGGLREDLREAAADTGDGAIPRAFASRSRHGSDASNPSTSRFSWRPRCVGTSSGGMSWKRSWRTAPMRDGDSRRPSPRACSWLPGGRPQGRAIGSATRCSGTRSWPGSPTAGAPGCTVPSPTH